VAVAVEAYILFIQPTNLGGVIWVDDVSFHEVVATGDVPEPRNFELHQNVPNPFNPVPRIDFHLKHEDTVNLSVYDVAGRRIATLFRDRLDAGLHQVMRNGKAESGSSVASGVYWYALRTSNRQGRPDRRTS